MSRRKAESPASGPPGHTGDHALEAAFHALMQKSKRQAYRITGDPDVAEDLAVKALEPVFRDLWANPALLDDPTALEKYRSRRVKGRIYNWKCTNVVSAEHERELAIEMELRDAWTEPDFGMREPEHRALDAAVEGLPRTERRSFMLVHAEGKSAREAADQLGMKIGTVEKAVYRAKRRLRDKLAALGITSAWATLKEGSI